MASFQNSLFYFDYKINRDFYEALCVNEATPELECNGKCQVREESQKTQTPLSEIKYSFEFTVLPIKSIGYIIEKHFLFTKKTQIVSINNTLILHGFYYIIPHPPQNLG